MKKKIIRDILKVFAVGGIALLMAVTAEFLAYMSFVLFCLVPTLTGYLAMCAFFGALIAIVGAIGLVFMCGAWMVRKGKFVR